MDSRLLFVFVIGFIGVYNVETEARSLSREKRQNINPLEIIIRVQEMVEKCKKPNPPAGNNSNIIQNFIDDYDMKCLFEGVVKIIQEIEHSSQSRRKRDTAQTILDLMKLQQAVQACEKSGVPANASILEKYDLSCVAKAVVEFIKELTPPSKTELQVQHSRRKRDTAETILDLMKLQQAVQECQKSGVPANATIFEKYDLGCVTKAVIEFIKELTPPSNTKRSKRALRISDITCFIMKVVEEEPKIAEVIRAFTRRTRREAGAAKLCEDFGHAMDSILQIIEDFAPGRA